MDVMQINPNFDARTFFLDSKQNTTKQNTLKKNILTPLGFGVTGGAIGDIFARKKYSKVLESAIDKHNNSVYALLQFLETSIENDSILAAKKNPYDDIVTWLDKMKQFKNMPSLEMPNCLLFIGQNENRGKNIIDWFAKSSRQRYIEFDAYGEVERFVDILEESEKSFKKTGKWNLVYAKDLDKLINPECSDSGSIASMKAIMCCSAQEYHTTILFQTKDVTKLDEIAIETNRIDAFYDTDHMRLFNKFKKLFNNYIEHDIKADNIEKSKNKVIAKGFGIGLAIGALIGICALVIKKVMQEKGKIDEDKK